MPQDRRHWHSVLYYCKCGRIGGPYCWMMPVKPLHEILANILMRDNNRSITLVTDMCDRCGRRKYATRTRRLGRLASPANGGARHS